MNISNTLAFLAALNENNHKPWFDENRKWYEEVKADLQKTVCELIKSIGEFEPEIGDLQTKDCIFRINRDVRFAKDKSPYKTNMGAYFAKGGKKSKYAGYYMHIDPTETFIAAGIWQPEPAELVAIRQEIDYHFEDFTSILKEKNLTNNWGELQGEKLANVPKGYEKENPAAEYLKHKSFILMHKIPLNELKKVDLVKLVTNQVKIAKPFNDFLNKAVDV